MSMYDKVVAGIEVSIIEIGPKKYWACFHQGKDIGGNAKTWDEVEEQIKAATGQNST